MLKLEAQYQVYYKYMLDYLFIYSSLGNTIHIYLFFRIYIYIYTCIFRVSNFLSMNPRNALIVLQRFGFIQLILLNWVLGYY